MDSCYTNVWVNVVAHISYYDTCMYMRDCVCECTYSVCITVIWCSHLWWCQLWPSCRVPSRLSPHTPPEECPQTPRRTGDCWTRGALSPSPCPADTHTHKERERKIQKGFIHKCITKTVVHYIVRNLHGLKPSQIGKTNISQVTYVQIWRRAWWKHREICESFRLNRITPPTLR